MATDAENDSDSLAICAIRPARRFSVTIETKA
jgi:hypothetical protein